jgi:hypothetical protein
MQEIVFQWLTNSVFLSEQTMDRLLFNVLLIVLAQNCWSKFDIHGSVHRRLLSRNANKMQLCNRIYYSKNTANTVYSS